MSGNEMSIGDAIKAVLKEHGLQEAFDQAGVVNLWKQIVGTAISQHTTHLHFDKGVLYVKMDNAGLRHELSFARDKMCQQLNLAMSANVVKDIVFI